MGVRQDKVVIPRRSRLRQFNFVFAVETDLYWQHLGGGYGSAGMRPERRPGAGMAGRCEPPRSAAILARKR
jgi:hypothetical protein